MKKFERMSKMIIERKDNLYVNTVGIEMYGDPSKAKDVEDLRRQVTKEIRKEVIADWGEDSISEVREVEFFDRAGKPTDDLKEIKKVKYSIEVA